MNSLDLGNGYICEMQVWSAKPLMRDRYIKHPYRTLVIAKDLGDHPIGDGVSLFVIYEDGSYRAMRPDTLRLYYNRDEI